MQASVVLSPPPFSAVIAATPNGTVVPRKERRNAVRPDFRPTCASAALGAQETNEAAISATQRNRTPFIGHLLGRGPTGDDPRLDLLTGHPTCPPPRGVPGASSVSYAT